jgi:hypothetical protein
VPSFEKASSLWEKVHSSRKKGRKKDRNLGVMEV